MFNGATEAQIKKMKALRKASKIPVEDTAETEKRDSVKETKSEKAPRGGVKEAAKDLKEKGDVKPKDKKPRKKKSGVCALISGCLIDGMTPEEIVEQIREKFPESKADKNSVTWMAWKMKKDAKK
jgi:hypothetical protein